MGQVRSTAAFFFIVEPTLLSVGFEADVEVDPDVDLTSVIPSEVFVRDQRTKTQSRDLGLAFARSPTLVPIAFPAPKHTKDAQDGGPAANAAGPFFLR